MRRWGFLTNHAMVLIHVIRNTRSTVREIAIACGITERATLSILRDIRAAEIVDCERDGRRNIYSINFEAMARYRRQGPSQDLLPDPFVSELVLELMRLGKDDTSAPAAEPDNVRYIQDGHSRTRKSTVTTAG